MSDGGPRFRIDARSEVMRSENLEFLGRFGFTDLYRVLEYHAPCTVARANHDDCGYSQATYYLSPEGSEYISPEAREFLKAYVQLMR